MTMTFRQQDWRYDPVDGHVIDGNNDWVCDPHCDDAIPVDDREQNAKLLAAAPAMHKMLLAVISHNDALVPSAKMSPALIRHIEQTLALVE